MTHLLNEIITILTLAVTFNFLLRKCPRPQPSVEPETAIVNELIQEVVDAIYGASTEDFQDAMDYWAENGTPVEEAKPTPDYLSLGNKKLRALCKERGIKIPHANTKSALVKVLTEHDA